MALSEEAKQAEIAGELPRDARRRRGGCLLVSIVLVALISFVGYAVGKTFWAAGAIESFCDDVRIGAPVAGLEEAARERGFRVRSIAPHDGGQGMEPRPGVLMVSEGFATIVHSCHIDHDGDVVLGKLAATN